MFRLASRQPDSGLVVELLPANNEEDQIADAIRSLHEQSSPPEMIFLLADNCTDGTAVIADNVGAHAYETVDDAYEKAAALN